VAVARTLREIKGGKGGGTGQYNVIFMSGFAVRLFESMGYGVFLFWHGIVDSAFEVLVL